MFERHFALRENPFPAGHQLRFLYPSREHQEARAHLRYGIENREPFVLISGEVGTGKTTALYDALAEWGNQIQVALITNSALTRQELIEEIGLRFGVSLPSGASKPHVLVALERHLLATRARGEWAVLLLDEAQNLAMDLLEEIRLLSNLEAQGEKLLQIFLVGQPELELKLARPELRQLRQRITVHYRLNPLSPEETAGYIHHRISVAGGNAWVIFPPESCREVFRLTHGIPREINTVASAAMLAAYAEGAPSVRPEHVHAVAHESEFRSVLSEPAPPAAEHVPPPAPVVSTPVPPAPPAASAPPPLPPEPARPAASTPPAWSRTPAPPRPQPAPAVPVAQEAHGTPPPAWRPPALESAAAAPAHVEQVGREEIDAWSAAARELMAARRRSTPEASPPPLRPARTPIAHATAAAAAPPPPAFPTPEELAARQAPDPGAAPDYANLPPSLRQKLEQAERAEKRGASPLVWAIGLLAIALVVVVAVMIQRFGKLTGETPESASAPASSPVASATPPVMPPVDSVAVRDTARAQNEQTEEAPARVAPPVRPPALRPAPVAAAPAATPPAARPDSIVWGIVVAQYLNQDRAEAERERLAAETSLPGRLVTYRDAGVTMYRLILGRFGSQETAETRAGALLDARVVDQANVVSLGRASR
jgi:type II secretory pathway predicted ATPase ExeA